MGDYGNLDIPFIPMEEIEAAVTRLQGCVRRTPLYELDVQDLVKDERRIFIKLENLQDTGSFKVRGARNAISALISREGKDVLSNGVFTCSSGNFALGLARNCQHLGVPCSIVAPDNADKAKLSAIKGYGASIVKVPYDTWWNVMTTHQYESFGGKFIHPCCNRDVIAGFGTVGLEIIEDLDNIDVVVTPYGGGSLATGTGSVLKALKPDTALYVCEAETSAPLATSFKAGCPSVVANYRTSFVGGMGGKSVFPQMWSLARNLIKDSMVVSLDDICEAVRLLFERQHIVAEGAGAAPLAAALEWHSNEHVDLVDKTIVCVVSGGNIDSRVLVQILNEQTP